MTLYWEAWQQEGRHGAREGAVRLNIFHKHEAEGRETGRQRQVEKFTGNGLDF